MAVSLMKRVAGIKKSVVKSKKTEAEAGDQPKPLQWYTFTKSLSEEYQSTGMQFAFVSADSKVCHPWVLCRDFLHDAVRAKLTGNPFSIYGFSYDPSKDPSLDTEVMRMAVSKKDKLLTKQKDAFDEVMIRAKKVLNAVEQLAGIPANEYTSLTEVDPKGSNRDVVYLFTGSGFWMKSPLFVSMYTFFIRLSVHDIKFETPNELIDALDKLTKSKGAGNDRDIGYLKSIFPHLMLALTGHDQFIKPAENGFHELFYIDRDNSTFHHRSGVVSILTGGSSSDALNKTFKELTKKGRKG